MLFAPKTDLETHVVSNQPPELSDRNLFTTDPVFRAAALREGGDWLEQPLSTLGEEVGSEEVMSWGVAANRHPPELRAFDRFGRRIDEMSFHPAYHALMQLAMAHRIHDIAWTANRPGGHVAHLALLALFTQAEAGVMCPVNMTYASVPALRRQPDVTAEWTEKLLGGSYDPPLRPIAEKSGITIGMAMTEKQGGSDVRANETRAYPIEARRRAFSLYGHKWFCSAPMSDGFLTLAQTDAGLSCFLVPRITPDGERNGIQLMRLKDKLGNRSNASAEIEYHEAYAELLGEEGQGIKVIIDMVHHTRLGTIGSTLGIMRMALAQAIHHVEHRRAFQKRLIDQPAMRAVIADLALDYEAAVALAMRVARSFDATDEEGRAFSRLSVALAKFWLTKRAPNFVYECMECLGGAGYIEEGPMPRLYREAPVNAIWEGSGNVIALDILRTLAREPVARVAYLEEVEQARGGNTRLDGAIDELVNGLSRASSEEGQARATAEQMAVVLEASLLMRHAPSAIADSFCAARLGADRHLCYGAGGQAVAVDAIIARHAV
ncbi:acyl-CoA dehydrogenase family protein [Rhodoligotrophos defluvii]|uniref:acyl-CoA dehydrogenase family protein n=1 Tax=Rhodoligotrophos defluvii TaxID=2561934 RepID=UPI0010CA0DD9|nr:acyl-CoA dehydrogenase family protein [Rhodoligotrophos defluvii]